MMNRVRTILLSAGLAAVCLRCIRRRRRSHGPSAGGLRLRVPVERQRRRVSEDVHGGGNGPAILESVAHRSGQSAASAARAAAPRGVQIAAPVDAAMASGDVLMVSFWMRSGAAGEATLDAGFRALPVAARGSARSAGAPGRRAGGSGSAGQRARRRGSTRKRKGRGSAANRR